MKIANALVLSYCSLFMDTSIPFGGGVPLPLPLPLPLLLPLPLPFGLQVHENRVHEQMQSPLPEQEVNVQLAEQEELLMFMLSEYLVKSSLL